jgi:tyrosine-protein phosphatase YwqE
MGLRPLASIHHSFLWNMECPHCGKFGKRLAITWAEIVRENVRHFLTSNALAQNITPFSQFSSMQHSTQMKFELLGASIQCSAKCSHSGKFGKRFAITWAEIVRENVRHFLTSNALIQNITPFSQFSSVQHSTQMKCELSGASVQCSATQGKLMNSTSVNMNLVNAVC